MLTGDVKTVCDRAAASLVDRLRDLVSPFGLNIGARGPKLDGVDQFYNQMIGKTKPNLRKGDEITIALDPTDPDKYAMLIPEMSQYFGDARPTGSTAMWNQNDAEPRGPFYEN